MRDVEGGQRRAGRRRRRIIFVDFELFLAGANEPQNLRHFALIIGVTGDAARETEINQSAVVCVAPIDARRARNVVMTQKTKHPIRLGPTGNDPPTHYRTHCLPLVWIRSDRSAKNNGVYNNKISSESRFFDRFSGFEAVFWRFWGKF